ncbi:unnamed protein product [Brassica oleracea var. botrytis]|uniref:S-protein homolog n=1 Tax=Brassica oleracea TaxID=3712 RepID=A0A3P6DX29_BRAOL|nr:unnamed protein product [Brassica oleracea]
MNKFIVFLFAITICFVLSEGCAKSNVEIRNELGKGIMLEIECKTVEPTKNLGRVSIPFNDRMGYGFVAVHERRHRTIHTCNIWFDRQSLNISTYDGPGFSAKEVGGKSRYRSCSRSPELYISDSQFVLERIVSHDVDGIQIKPKSRHIWIDRRRLRCEVIGLCLWFICESCDWCLVLCSWFYRCQHDKTMLIGADPSHVDDRKNCLVINLNFFSNLDWIFFQF